MSDSERDRPSDEVIAQKLRDIVISLHKAGNDDELTVKRVRTRAEKDLGLDEGLLKTSAWKDKSAKTIQDAVTKYCIEEAALELVPEATPKKVSKPAAKPAAKKEKAPTVDKGTKRKKTAPAPKPKKRRKTESDDGDDLDSEADAVPKKINRTAKRPTVQDSDDDSDVAPAKRSAETPSPEVKDDKSDSEMSSLIDESPKPKSRQKKEPAAKVAKPKAKETPDTAEIKKLQGWLVKCGIRKVWSRDPELSKCDTDKEKISVLKRMLKDVGVDGKFSVEKAAKIKEEREFAKDLEAIQEAEAHWGAAEDTGGRPRRRAAAAAVTKPQQKLVFSDDSEEEQSAGDDDDDNSGDDDDEEDMDDDSNGASDDNKDDSEGDDSD